MRIAEKGSYSCFGSCFASTIRIELLGAVLGLGSNLLLEEAFLFTQHCADMISSPGETGSILVGVRLVSVLSVEVVGPRFLSDELSGLCIRSVAPWLGLP